eukprot:1008229-Karenia_brevis.AAC.1
MRLEAGSVAKAEYGQHLVMAAIGALEKGDSTFRIIHDGTHEKRNILPRAARLSQSHFGLKADVSKAHRRVKIARCDHGHTACQTRPGYVWLNQVGTFGLGSAGYWLSRFGGAVSRLVLSVMGKEEIWLLLFAEDVDIVAAGANATANLILSLFLLILVGTPVSWKKVGGGF